MGQLCHRARLPDHLQQPHRQIAHQLHGPDAAALQAIDLCNREAELEVREGALQRHETALQCYAAALQQWVEEAEEDLRQRGQELCQRGKAVKQVRMHIMHSSLPQAAPS